MFGEGIINEIVKPLINAVYKNFNEKQQKESFAKRLLEYQETLYKKCEYQKTLLHRFEDIKIDDFYIPLFLAPYQGYGVKSTERLSTDSIKNLFPANAPNTFKKKFEKDGKNIVIFGFAGGGKSTLVKHLIVSSIKEQHRIPIYVELRNLVETVGNFEEYIINNIFQFKKHDEKDRGIQTLLKDGSHFLFVLDGFDEIPSQYKTIANTSLSDFIATYSKNDFIITSRYYEPLSLFGRFQNYEICEFTKEEVRAFVLKQFNNQNKNKAFEIINELSKAHNSSINEYLKTPLLLSLFIITYVTHPEIPFNKSEFYYNIFDSLFYRLDKYLKADFVHEKISKLSKEDFNKILSRFAFIAIFENKYEFTEKYINEKIDLIKNLKEFRFTTEDFLLDLTNNIGIILQDGIYYKFPHRTLQDYFCANFLISITERASKERVYKDISAKINDHKFLIDLLLEIDYIEALEYIVLPAVSNYMEKIFNTINSLTINSHPLTYSTIKANEETLNYILQVLENFFELRYIKSTFRNFRLSQSDLIGKLTDYALLLENCNSGVLKEDVLAQLKNIENAKFLYSEISKHIEINKKQDKSIIDIVKSTHL